jgi:hypothetical protein
MSPDMTVAIMGDDLDTIWIYYCRGGEQDAGSDFFVLSWRAIGT